MTSRSNTISSARLPSCEGIDTVEKGGNFEGVRVRVHLWDEEKVLFFKNYDITAQQVCDEIARKEKLQESSKSMFSLWIIGNDLELQLKPNQDLFAIVEKFPRYVEKYTHKTSGFQWKFYYKREALFTLENDRKVKDPNAIKLLYGESLFNVISGRYPITEEQATSLAGIQLQVIYGDIKPEVHKKGFLQNMNFKGYLPEYLVEKIKGRLEEVEDKILDFYQGNAGKPEMISHLLYLQQTRLFPFYGSTKFLACKEIPPRGFFELRTDTIAILINSESITIVDEEKHKIMHTFRYDDVTWNASKDMLTFEGDDLDLSYVTPQASLASSLIARAIKNLDKNDERIQGMRDQQSNYDTL